MTFSSVLSALGLAPKTIPQATAALENAKGTLDSVSALFTAAGLNLETMLAGGSDSLKAHLASVGAKDGELAAAQTEIADLKGKLSTATTEATAATAKFSTVSAALLPLGITAATKPEEYPALINSHVKKEAATELAKTGHAPVATISAADAVVPSATASRDEHYKFLATLPKDEQHPYFKKHLARKF